jgi:N-acyl-D-aspartate/D-glutamate deacylase
LIQRSDGIHYTIVNGHAIYENGRLTGALPGQLLRGSSYRGRQAAAA